MAGRTRPALVSLAAVALAAVGVGCFNSHNPGYFPYYLPGGRIVETHAKPRFGFFRDFDPKACTLEVAPQNATAPLGSQIVLLASVYDKDGQPRRSRRVEWILEGPGNIIEVDESGVYPGRGYKVDNKYAVTHTTYTTHTITRGNDDPKDDVTICPGQTFCVISSAVPGETTITAYAPGVFNWDNGRVVSKIVWGEGRFIFPAPAVVKYGGELTLKTTVNQFESDGPEQPNYRVRYRILDSASGDSVTLVSRNGSGAGGSQSGTDAKETEAAVDASGAAAVRLVQFNPKPGKTRVAVEVVKLPENGVGPGTVVSRRETEVEWTAPEVTLNVVAPPAAGVSGAFPVTVSLTNAGKVDAREARVRVALSDGATLERSDPPPVKADSTGLFFDLPAVAVGKKQQVTLQVRPAKLGPVTVTAEATTADRLQAQHQATTQVDRGRLAVVAEVPPTALAGDTIPARVAVTNSGPTPAENVTVWAQLDGGLAHASNKNPVEVAAGSIAPGQTKTLDVPLTAKGGGRFGVRVTATGDGGLAASAEAATVEVRRAELKVAVVGPRIAYLNQDFTWTVAVGNTGDSTVTGAVVRATLPPEAQLKDAGEGKAGAGSVEWTVPELKPGDQRTFKLTLAAAKLADSAPVTVAAMGDATGAPGGKPTGDPVQARAEATVAIIGTPAVLLEVVAPPGVVEVGKRVTYQVRVRNQGTVSARNVEVTAVAPPELKVTRARGAADARVDSEGKVSIPSLEELKPGQMLTCVIEAEAVQAGDGRFRVEVRAAHLNSPLKDEQPSRVVGGR
jgi:uncharacterized repeat protein (TIGR01451 family)